MPATDALRDPWLVAAWPGMGNVAVGAAGYLVVKLGARLVHELQVRDMFDVPHIDVQRGLASPGRLPRNMFFEWRRPGEGRDLLIFLGEAQPTFGGYSLCHKLLDYAQQRGVKRVVTFAAIASQLHPSEEPRVFGVATDPSGLQQLEALEVQVMQEGQVSGLNGVLLAAAAERGLPGQCLLGELPYFAAGVPNPKASQAVLEVFATLANIEIDFTELQEQAEAVEAGLLQLLEKMQEAAQQASEQGEESFTIPEFIQQDDEEEDDDEKLPAEAESQVAPKEPAKDKPRTLDYATRRRIDSMFEAAHDDRSLAFQLKQELDRLGVFPQYEDRFLDLFRKAG